VTRRVLTPHERATEGARRASDSRGVDRVPERLRGLAPTVTPHVHSKRGTVIDSTPKPRRPKVRKRLRTRELPGAVARRADRAERAARAASTTTEETT
jgi:hypothetical protein